MSTVVAAYGFDEACIAEYESFLCGLYTPACNTVDGNAVPVLGCYCICTDLYKNCVDGISDSTIDAVCNVWTTGSYPFLADPSVNPPDCRPCSGSSLVISLLLSVLSF